MSESSLKRWADGGQIRVARTLGGHRRIPVQEAIRFARASKLPIVRPDLLGIPELAAAGEARARYADLDEALFDKLKVGAAAEFRAVVLDLFLSGRSVASICDGPIRTAMARIGSIWEHERQGVFIEHRATDICLQTLSTLRSLIGSPEGPAGFAGNGVGGADGSDDDVMGRAPVALGGAPTGDPYLMPSLMAACVAAEAGYREVNLGPDTPLSSFEDAAAAHRPRLVWVSCSVVGRLPPTQEIERLADHLAELDAALVVGGRGVTDRVRRTTATNLHLHESMTELGELAKHLRVEDSADTG